ncbi:MAG: hypothetical protein DRJ40_01855 [Thermoprotei archaeon]|nr:MAG: hypothetical protein DRJ40_01855 [Thermoprotei archaeon]
MVTVLVASLIDQCDHLIARSLKEVDVESVLKLNTQVADELLARFDVVILGGRPFRLPYDCPKIINVPTTVLKSGKPVLGICLGHQLIAYAHEVSADPSTRPEYGLSELIVDEINDLYVSLPRRFTVRESHNDEVEEIPQLHKPSINCYVQLLKHVEKSIYTIQYHLGVYHTKCVRVRSSVCRR